MTFYRFGEYLGVESKDTASRMSDEQITELVFEYLNKTYWTEDLAEMIAYGNVEKPRVIAEKALDVVKNTAHTSDPKVYCNIRWHDHTIQNTKASIEKYNELMDLAKEMDWGLYKKDSLKYQDNYGDYPSSWAVKDCRKALDDSELLKTYIGDIQQMMGALRKSDKERPRCVALLEGLEKRLEEIGSDGSKKSSRSNNRKPRTARKPTQRRR